MTNQKETTILKNGNYVTEINFFHVDENNQHRVAEIIKEGAMTLAGKEGFISVNVLTSTDGTRICTYIQWQNENELNNAKEGIQHLWNNDFTNMLEDESGLPGFMKFIIQTTEANKAYQSSAPIIKAPYSSTRLLLFPEINNTGFWNW